MQDDYDLYKCEALLAQNHKWPIYWLTMTLINLDRPSWTCHLRHHSRSRSLQQRWSRRNASWLQKVCGARETRGRRLLDCCNTNSIAARVCCWFCAAYCTVAVSVVSSLLKWKWRGILRSTRKVWIVRLILNSLSQRLNGSSISKVFYSNLRRCIQSFLTNLNACRH